MSEKINTLTPQSAAQWVRKTEIVELPSGFVVELEKPDIMQMLLETDVATLPDYLSRVLYENMGVKTRPVNPDSIDLNAEMRKNIAFVNRVVMNSVRSVQVVESGADATANQINVGDIPFEDRQFISQRAMPQQEMKQAESFRQ